MKHYYIDGRIAQQSSPVHDGRIEKSAYRSVGKRMFDFVFAVMLLPIIAPVIAVLWIMVRRDGGPGFYWQDRVGLDGKHFKCYKLRTMVVDAEAALREMCERDADLAREWHENQKLSVDPRITKVGAFLRASSLDELPQIWNVLRGDMSFVGPRPFMPEQQEQYVSAGGTAYFHMRPGITGPWQVEGRGVTTFVSRIQYDSAYYKALSLKVDIKYLLKTVGVVLSRTGT